MNYYQKEQCQIVISKIIENIEKYTKLSREEYRKILELFSDYYEKHNFIYTGEVSIDEITKTITVDIRTKEFVNFAEIKIPKDSKTGKRECDFLENNKGNGVQKLLGRNEDYSVYHVEYAKVDWNSIWDNEIIKNLKILNKKYDKPKEENKNLGWNLFNTFKTNVIGIDNGLIELTKYTNDLEVKRLRNANKKKIEEVNLVYKWKKENKTYIQKGNTILHGNVTKFNVANQDNKIYFKNPVGVIGNQYFDVLTYIASKSGDLYSAINNLFKYKNLIDDRIDTVKAAKTIGYILTVLREISMYDGLRELDEVKQESDIRDMLKNNERGKLNIKLKHYANEKNKVTWEKMRPFEDVIAENNRYSYFEYEREEEDSMKMEEERQRQRIEEEEEKEREDFEFMEIQRKKEEDYQNQLIAEDEYNNQSGFRSIR